MNWSAYSLQHKKISIIIPCYNAVNTIDRCLDSIFNQSFDLNSLDIILIDDGSNDGTWEHLENKWLLYSSIIRMFKIPHGMQGRARNFGIELAKGDYLMFVDADDYLVDDIDALQRIWDVTEEYQPDVVRFLFEGDVYNADTTSDKYTNKIFPILNHGMRNELFAHYSLRRGCWDKLYKRQMVMQCHLRFPEGLIDEESGFVIPAYFCLHEILFVNKVLYHYTDNPFGTCGKMNRPGNFSFYHRTDNKVVWWELYHQFLKNQLTTNYELVEWVFIMNYYFATQTLNKQRGMPCDETELEQMAENVLTLFPNCMSHERFKNIEDSDTYPNISLLRKEK